MPAFGGPAIATARPSRSRSPRPASPALPRSRRASARTISKRWRTRSAGTSPSSEKSMPASTSASASISRPRQVSARSPSSPLSCRKACRRCASVSAAIRSARPSTAVRSSRPFSNARRVNSPASARRKPGRSAQAPRARRRPPPAAVQLQLGHVLAGLALRPREPQHQGLVDHLAGSRIAQRAQGGAWRGSGSRPISVDQRLPGARSGHPNHRDRRRRPARRQREDGIAVIAQLTAFDQCRSGPRRPGPGPVEIGCRNLRRTIWTMRTRRALSSDPAEPHRKPDCHCPKRARKPPRARDQSVSAAAQAQSGRLVALGPGGARRGQAQQQADPALGRLRRLPLVPRHGARKLRGRRHRRGDERAVRQHQGRSRGAARHRPDLHVGAASSSASRAAGR